MLKSRLPFVLLVLGSAILSGCSNKASSIQNMTPAQQGNAFAAHPDQEPESVKLQVAAQIKNIHIPSNLQPTGQPTLPKTPNQ